MIDEEWLSPTGRSSGASLQLGVAGLARRYCSHYTHYKYNKVARLQCSVKSRSVVYFVRCTMYTTEARMQDCIPEFYRWAYSVPLGCSRAGPGADQHT